ncbi:hypothetical protein AtubIFM57258_001190 [Aspergillus tubingensis]|nr:hypothetical protein AtubIFM57258_001190 [Aspergillus tubingensis]
MATALDARTLVCSPIPNLLEGPSTTTSVTTQDLEYKAKLIHWNTFEKEVRQVFDSIHWDQQREILAYAPANSSNSPNNTWNEQLFCGDEHSVVARFNQNVGHVMTSVFQSLGLSSRFGDFKACKDSTLANKVPDVVLLTDGGRLRIVGEAKTPWKHVLKDAFEDQYKLRHILGQLARYLYGAQIKYGFLTTYRETIFVKQEPYPNKEKGGQMALWHSDVIKHTTRSANFDPDGDFKGCVSLRQCFLFMGKMATESPVCENPLGKNQWVGSSKTSVFGDEDYISPSTSSSEEGSEPGRGRSRQHPPLPAASQSQYYQSLQPSAQPPSNTSSGSRYQTRSSATSTHQLPLRSRGPQPQHLTPTAHGAASQSRPPSRPPASSTHQVMGQTQTLQPQHLVPAPGAASQSRSSSRPPASLTYQVMGQTQTLQPRHLAPAPGAANQSRSQSRSPAPSAHQVMSQSQSSLVHPQSQSQNRRITRSQTKAQSEGNTTQSSPGRIDTVYYDSKRSFYINARGEQCNVALKQDKKGYYFDKGDTRHYVQIKELKEEKEKKEKKGGRK